MKLAKLQRLTLDEVVCRGRQRASRLIDRLMPAFGPARELFAGGTAAESRDRFASAVPLRFFAGAGQPIAPIIQQRFPDQRAATIAAADRASAGRFDLLGYRGLDFGSPIDWHLEPVANVRAPRRHWTTIDPLASDQVGDSKVVWELNRHQWIVTLAQAWALTRDDAYAESALAALDSWCDENPYGQGLNWTSSLEAGLRIIAWSWTLTLLRTAPALTPERHARISATARAHARHVERYLSHYFSPNTHLTGEALGLLYAGIVFADAADAARWRDCARQILINESERQIVEDGIYCEQASCYHRYTLELYLHALILASRNGLVLPDSVARRVKALTSWLVSIVDHQGRMPSIGDADGGWILPLTAREPNDCRGVLAVAAAYFDDAELAWAARGNAVEVAWLLGANGLETFDRLRPRPPARPASRAFRSSGYAVMRSGWDADDHTLILDAGPMGADVSGAHAHADLLSVQCRAFGEDVLIDPGTFCYTASPAWRNHFRGTIAHNTVRIDGRDQAEPAGPFAWRSRPAARLTDWTSQASHDYADAAHDAYASLPSPVTHRRRVVFVKPLGWVIVDDLLGGDAHDVELRFHFAPSPLTLDAGWARMPLSGGRGVWLRVLAPLPLEPALHVGAAPSMEGWYAPAYGDMRPAPVIVHRGTLPLPARVTTVVLPVDRLTDDAPGLVIEFDDTGAVSTLRLPDDDRVVRIAAGAIAVDRDATRQRIA